MKPATILISGLKATGKTTLAHQLRECFAQHSIPSRVIDDYRRTKPPGKRGKTGIVICTGQHEIAGFDLHIPLR